tara:strand:- start:1590 stop:2330 length:741 start_codon:yes stop_codon:yes gene_type:complete
MFCENIKINELEYKDPQSNRNGGKVVHVSTVPGSSEWRDRLRFQMSEDQKTNLQTAVWGLSTPLAGQDTSRRTLELTIESEQLHNFLQNMDNHNKSTAQQKSPLWFKKEVDASAIEQMYVSLIKQPSKPDQKATVRVKVKCGEYPTNIYVVDNDSTEENLSYHKGKPEDLARGVKCMVMVETVGLWFMSRQFGMSLTASEIMVWPAKKTTGINAFTLTTNTSLKEINDVKNNNEDMRMESESMMVE